MPVAALLRGPVISTHARSVEAVRYCPSLKKAWDAFVSKAKNSTFLFQRDYMDYHAQRFADYSLMLYRGSQVVAVLPGNSSEPGVVQSHQGLTYGGLVLHRAAALGEVMGYFEAALAYLHDQQISTLRYKRMPGYYSGSPTDDAAYCLFVLDAVLYRRECCLVIPMADRLPLQKRRKRQIKKAIRANLALREETDFEPFWERILVPRLLSRYHVHPVHTLAEIRLLASRFPENIRQFSAYDGGEIVAGITIYETPTVARAQYIATSDKGRKTGALDHLVTWLLDERYAEKQFFDFGGSNEQESRSLNHGLLEWKEGFGARCCSLDSYEIQTANYQKLEPFLAGAVGIGASMEGITAKRRNHDSGGQAEARGR